MLLDVRNIEVVYNNVIIALRGVSLQVPESGKVALLGANSAGKSTTLKTISGILKSQEGEIKKGTIEFDRCKLNNLSPQKIVRMGITQCPENRRLFTQLTVDENLKAGAISRKDNIKGDYDMVMEYFPILKQRKNQKAGYLSGGEAQMLAIGRALMARPKLLTIDEPSLGLAPLIVSEIFEILDKINREKGTAILVVEQNAMVALDFVEYGYIIENGIIVMDGPAKELRENRDVKEFYLGLTSESTTRKSYREVKHYKRRKRWLVSTERSGAGIVE